MKRSWAVLLVTFPSDRSRPHDRAWYERFFTSAGAGTGGMHDFWTDMSLGAMDLSASQVFGWYDLDLNYTGSGANPPGREELVVEAKKAARADGVAVDDFHVVVVLNGMFDLFGDTNGAVGGDDGKDLAISGLAPSLIGQEMGHVLGLAHSRQLGSDADYQDAWDIMSTAPDSAFIANNPDPQMNQMSPLGRPVYGIGPGLNAANMWSLGWLDESRVWTMTGDVDTQVQLRPLHHRERQGYLAARFGEFFIELRVPERWDAGIGSAVVLVHVFEGGHSHLVADSKGRFDWTVGSQSGIDGLPDPPEELGLGFSRITVDAIDPVARTATISVTHSTGHGPQYFPEWWPRRRIWDLVTLRHDDTVLVTGGRELLIEASTPLAQVVRGAITMDAKVAVEPGGVGDILAALNEPNTAKRLGLTDGG